MAISGTTSTCQITTNTQFVLSGLGQTNLSTINITDENGLDVSECFGIETKIITVQGMNVTLTGDCNTSLEIKITSGVSQPVNCDFVDYIQDGSDFIIFEFADGTTSDNIHPECCTALGFTPEIDEAKCYYVCRWREPIDSQDCNNYSPRFEFNEQGWQIFDYAGGGQVTTVPSAECCYDEFVEEVQTNGDVKCIEKVPFDPCEGLILPPDIPIPDFGIITFEDSVTGVQTQVVPNSECCTSNGFNFQSATGGGFNCYNSLIAEQPTVTILNETCCEVTTTGGDPLGTSTTTASFSGIYERNDPVHPEGGTLVYIDENGIQQTRTLLFNTSCITITYQEIISRVGVANGCDTLPLL